jgi:NAD(P)-dependent dehydrogenase (short-subunit alcohol dehydrogenase family)
MSVNLKGIWWCMKYELPQMLKQGGGAIVNTSSVAGLVGTPMAAAYTAAKHGVAGLTKTAALEYAPHGIRVNAICPGLTRTAMVERLSAGQPQMIDALTQSIPMRRACHPSEIAAAALWLCTEGASYVNGLVMPIDGGFVSQ